jgi:hypothetical protein
VVKNADKLVLDFIFGNCTKRFAQVFPGFAIAATIPLYHLNRIPLAKQAAGCTFGVVFGIV